MFKKFFVFIFFALLVLSSSAYWFYNSSKPVSNDTALKDFLIVKGSSASQVGASLVSAGLVKNALAFKLYVQLTGKQGKIQAGEYSLSPSYSLFKLVEELGSGPTEIWVTIPEGLRREEVAQKFAESFGQGKDFEGEFLVASGGDEGFLFPDTYLFSKTASASAVVQKMLAVFNQKVDSQIQKDIKSSGNTLGEIMTMASLIERETKTSEERPIVAGILYNRIRLGMPLQVDASVQYAIATSNCKSLVVGCDWWPETSTEDRSINSVFNTYTNTGLPPGPIANPGLSSIKAAIYPTQTDYLYYLHDSKGQIHYAKTLEEHNQNINTFL